MLPPPREIVRSFGLCDSEEGTREPGHRLVVSPLKLVKVVPPLPPLVIVCPAAIPLPDVDPGVGEVPIDEGLLTFRS